MADKKISALTASSTPLAGTEVLPIVQSGATVKVAVSDLTAGRSVSMSTMTATDGTRQTYTSVSSSNNVIRQTNGLTYEWAYGLSAPGVAGLEDKYSITRFNGTGWTRLSSMDSSGNQTLETGNLVIGTSGKGIDFSATPGTGTSELLADYEEGTWTPNQGAGLVVVGTFSSQGTYTKIGRMVYITGRVTGSTSVAINGPDFICTNLPFTIGAASVGASNTGTLSQPGEVIAFSGSSLYGTTTAAASFIYFSVSYPV